MFTLHVGDTQIASSFDLVEVLADMIRASAVLNLDNYACPRTVNFIRHNALGHKVKMTDKAVKLAWKIMQ